MADLKKFLDQGGVSTLWSRVAAKIAEEEALLINVINAIDETKADRSELVQSDWKQTDKTALDFIKNKPETLVECPSEEIVADILQNVYPVGAIYLSANNISPASLFGGTWEQIQDRFLLGAGSAYTAGSTGGESTHTLIVQEMPVHSHTVNAHSHAIGLDNDTTIGTYGWSLHVNANGNSVTGAQKIVTSGTSSPNTNTIGGSVAHNNMPPYLTVYMWKRIE